jgi:hypothetical protein
MLQYSAIEPRTLEVLKKLMSLSELSGFYLAGGTALALYYGHRLSIDLDLFSTVDFNSETLILTLEKVFPDFTYSAPGIIGVFGFIGNIKIDLVRYHRYQLIDTPHIEDGIRLMSINDIMAMNVAAILKRAVKKDFWDIAELLDHHTMAELISCYNKKYPNQQLLISIPQALIYFADAEESEDPIGLKQQTWTDVKKKIGHQVSGYLR